MVKTCQSKYSISNDTEQNSLIVLMDQVLNCVIYIPDVKLFQHINMCHP